jgi:hypothetical protein
MSWRSTSLRLGGWRSRWPDSPWRSDPGKWSLQHAARRENATAPHAVDFPVEPDDQRRAAIDLHRLNRHLGADHVQADSEQASHSVGPHDRPQRGLFDSATVTQEDDVRREDVEQAL